MVLSVFNLCCPSTVCTKATVETSPIRGPFHEERAAERRKRVRTVELVVDSTCTVHSHVVIDFESRFVQYNYCTCSTVQNTESTCLGFQNCRDILLQY
jgi:hypothetical protein